MVGFCRKCRMRYEGSNCPICHGERGTNAKPIAISVVIVGIVIMMGFLIYSGGIQIDKENLDQSIQDIPDKFQDASETVKDLTVETTSKLNKIIDEELMSVKLEPIEIIENEVKNTPVNIQEKNQLNQPRIDKTELEKQIHSLTNQYRIQNGLKALSWDDKLSNIARNHSKDMAARDYFSHNSLEGKDPTDRGNSQGYRCQKTIGNLIYSGIAENIFQNNLYDSVTIIGIVPIYDWNSQDDLAQSTVDGWMKSSGHRENILTNTYDREGVGVEISSDDKVFITQNFC